MANFAKEVTDTAFESDVLGSDKPVLVDFWAEWCAPCRAIAPAVEALAEAYDGKARVYKLNVDENAQAASQFGVRAIPTLILFKDGEEQERMVGFVSKEALEKVVDKYL